MRKRHGSVGIILPVAQDAHGPYCKEPLEEESCWDEPRKWSSQVALVVDSVCFWITKAMFIFDIDWILLLSAGEELSCSWVSYVSPVNGFEPSVVFKIPSDNVSWQLSIPYLQYGWFHMKMRI